MTMTMSMKENSITLKSTRVGRRFMRFVVAFNSGDPDQLRAYIGDNYDENALAEYSIDAFADWYWNLYEETGGLRVHKVFLSEEYTIMVIVQAALDGALYLHKMKVAHEPPNKVIEYLCDPLDEAFSGR
jgi:hypothetical protein